MSLLDIGDSFQGQGNLFDVARGVVGSIFDMARGGQSNEFQVSCRDVASV